MPGKDVHLFDTSNNPLKVAGIRLELFDAVTCTLLDVQNSANLNPGAGASSSSWGVTLSFPSGGNPLDIYVIDPTYQYPGNTVRYLNGQTPHRIDLDLMKLPSTPSGNVLPSHTISAAGLSRWVGQPSNWTREEKRAVRSLIFNYIGVVVDRIVEHGQLPQALHDMAANWGDALRKLKIDPDALST
jgi:hypothetical protein